MANDKPQHFVIRKLKDGWSPEIVSHVWNSLNYEQCTCIYNFINQRRIELIPCAGRKYKKRYSTMKTLISERVGIEKRPKIIDDRRRVSDLEVDT